MKIIAMGMIRIYQMTISRVMPSSCRFLPTCSQYTYEAIEEWGFWRGIYLGIRRIMRCNPWGGHGEDPIPKRGGKES